VKDINDLTITAEMVKRLVNTPDPVCRIVAWKDPYLNIDEIGANPPFTSMPRESEG
jgi:hypothetical protein